MTDTQTPQTDDRMLALLAEGERLRAVLDAALDCIVAMDASGRVLAWNPAAARTFGWSAGEALGREMADLIVPPALRERHRAGLARYLAGGDPVLLDVNLPDTDGFAVAAALTGEPEGPAVVITSTRDADDVAARVRACGARGFVPKGELSGAALDAVLAER